MAEKLTREIVAARATIHAKLPQSSEYFTDAESPVDRTFTLPTALFGITAAAYFGFIGIMAASFGNPGLIMPLSIIAFFLVMACGVPAAWVRMKPEANKSHAKSWSRFMSEGVETYTGRIEAGSAIVQVLILPVLILVWGLAVVTIAALV